MKTVFNEKTKLGNILKHDKRNNANSVGSNNCCSFNISRNNNKSSV